MGGNGGSYHPTYRGGLPMSLHVFPQTSEKGPPTVEMIFLMDFAPRCHDDIGSPIPKLAMLVFQVFMEFFSNSPKFTDLPRDRYDDFSTK